jgi:exonuclease SbcC
MVPVRLRLRNFLSYREACEPIDFAGLDLVCLSGQNGHGKSALLDAITWALWGKARGGTDDDLVHRGMSEAEVELEFRVGDVLYRTLRKRRRPANPSGQGRTDLQFQVHSSLGWKSLTGQSPKDTEAKIIAAIRLDYETFRNSAFLAQGRADEFTTKPAGKRKEVLAGILGLDAYDRYERRAREQAKEYDAEIRRHGAHIEQLERQLTVETQAQCDARESRAELDDLAADLKTANALLSAAEEAERAATGLRQRRDGLAKEIVQWQTRLTRAATDEREATETACLQRAVLERAEQIRSDFAALQQARATAADHTQRLALVRGLEREKATAEQEIAGAGAALKEKVRQAQAEVERQSAQAARLESIGLALEALHARQRDLADDDARLASLRDEKSAAEVRAAELTAENKSQRAAMDEIKRKQNELREGGANCPICGSLLGEEGKQRLHEEYEQQGKALAATFRENKLAIEELSASATRLGGEVAALERSVNSARIALSRESATLEQEEKQAREAAEKLPDLERECQQHAAALAGDSYAERERQRLAQVIREISDIGYDQSLHERAGADAHRLAGAERELAGLESAGEALAQAERQLARARADVAEAQAEVAAKQRDHHQALDELAGYEGAGERLAEAREQLGTLVDRERRARTVLGAAEQQLENCRRWRLDLAAANEQQTVARQQKQIYDDLTTAFGKKGVQALLIDAALPEIQEEANNLLATMTAGRMQVTLTTQRQSKSGQNLETLDIAISDDLGTRPYELYSGGEAFRINLALRIALSKLLARRAGAPLPTLIVDEGFGTQDGEGRERLMEALDAVADQFECLIVVTHIEELKNRFDRRIVVEKTPLGSVATLV